MVVISGRVCILVHSKYFHKIRSRPQLLHNSAVLKLKHCPSLPFFFFPGAETSMGSGVVIFTVDVELSKYKVFIIYFTHCNS